MARDLCFGNVHWPGSIGICHAPRTRWMQGVSSHCVWQAFGRSHCPPVGNPCGRDPSPSHLEAALCADHPEADLSPDPPSTYPFLVVAHS